MPLLDHLPRRPAPSRIVLWASVLLLVRALLLTAYVTLGRVQVGEPPGTIGVLVDELTGAIAGLLLVVVVVPLAARWPLARGRWREQLPKLFALFIGYSTLHTLSMEMQRSLVYPLIGLVRPLDARALGLAVAHELPNDLFYYALLVAAVQLWQFWWRVSERERRETELRRALAEAELTALRLQLQPHFLFNALNTVSSTMYDDPRRADSMLGELSELLRASLRIDRTDEVPLREELEIARCYVRLQQARFGDRLQVSFDVPDDCTILRLPVFVLQPLIENAVRHGRVERHGRGVVRVMARVAGDRLSVDVWDDGGAEAPTPGGGLGLRATAERLRLLYGDTATCSAGPDDGGWLVHLTMPARSAT